jgi:hypothetical protein
MSRHRYRPNHRSRPPHHPRSGSSILGSVEARTPPQLEHITGSFGPRFRPVSG